MFHLTTLSAAQTILRLIKKKLMDNEMQSTWKERYSGLTLYYHNTCLKKFRKITKKSDQRNPVCRPSDGTLYLTGDLSAV
jgi:hypothetical protein